MLLFAIAYLAGGLTILSPCILPVLPFVFAGADRPFRRSGLPMLAGMALTFALIATLAAVGGHWAIEANQAGRWAALALLALFGLALVWPALAERLSRPLVALGGRLSQAAERGDGTRGGEILRPLLLGIATGLVWAPCAGPVLGVILTAAALDGASVQTTLLLAAYAAGAATSLAAALLLGRRVFAAMTRGLGFGVWLRRGLGGAVLAGVVVIGLGLDTGLLGRLSLPGTVAIEQTLLDRLGPAPDMLAAMAASDSGLPVEGTLPSLAGATAWLNSPPLSSDNLRGKVVLVDFWTYSCINCLRALPHVRAWADKYREAGLVVLGVHAPEFAFEKSLSNVSEAVRDLNVSYPVAIDNDYALWRGFNNHYWPAHYLIDREGRIRYHHFGEGNYDRTEQVIRQMLAETGHSLPPATDAVDSRGIHAPADFAALASPETYLGHDRAENFRSPGGIVPDRTQPYALPAKLRRNEWALAGEWLIESERAVAAAAGGRIAFRFHARDLHLVLGPGENGTPIRFRVRLDGAAPGADHGIDTDAEGEGTVNGRRLYQLIRQTESSRDRTFEIEFFSPGLQAFAFTFG